MIRVKKIWLLSLVMGAVLMVFLGGLTRLTDSGLSITKWELVTGIFPPNSPESWQKAFQEYQKYPEYQKIKFSIKLSEFKFIYYMEYFHRLLGRILGLITLVPFVIFVFLKAVTLQEFLRYCSLLFLIMLQGFLGWYMIKSGLINNPDVSHYRLTLHFVAALLFICVSYWYFLEYSFVKSSTFFCVNRVGFYCLGVFLFFQIILGCFMAGLKAGHLSNTFPQIFGYYIPPGLFREFPWYNNFLENPLTIHFFHRFTGILMTLFVLIMWAITGQNLYKIFFSLNILQVFLGIQTVLSNVQIFFASIHQMFAIVLILVYVHCLYGIIRKRGV